MMQATAVVVNWKRPRNIPRIVESLLAQPFVGEVIIWDNSGELELPEHDKVRVIQSAENIKLWGRFQAIEQARHPWIATQDDDYIVHNWDELWETAQANPEVIAGNMHLNERGGGLIPCGQGWDIMLGWGSVFRKDLVVGAFDQYIAHYGIDADFMQEADRVFAVALTRKHRAIQAQVESLLGVDTDGIAMHRVVGHKDICREIRRRASE